MYKRQQHGLPATPFVSATSLSGLFDLEPLVPIYLNDALKLTNDEALAMSPAYRKRRVHCDFTAVVGGAELPEFLRQNQLLGAHWANVREWVLPNLNPVSYTHLVMVHWEITVFWFRRWPSCRA